MGAFGALIDDHRRGYQVAEGYPGDIEAVFARDLVDGGVEVGTNVFPHGDVVPVPGRSPFIAAAHDLEEGQSLCGL